MPVWTIDGEVLDAELLRRKGKYVVLKRLHLRGHDGAEHEFRNACAAGEVAEALTPGARGRFYLSKALDQTGVHGVRLDDGKAAQVWHNNMELISLITLGCGLVMTAIVLGGYRGLAVFGVLGLPIGAIFYAMTRKARREGQARFEMDATAQLVS